MSGGGNTQVIIEEVIQYLKSPEIISYPDFNLPFVVHCDASQTGLGAVLYQKREDKLNIVSFASRTLPPAERNYHLHSGKLEVLALKWCITEKFRDYLMDGPPFEVITDNNPLTYVLTTAKLNATGLRWINQLANYQFSIKYRSGKKHIDADFLSRHPVDEIKKVDANFDISLNLADVNVVLSQGSKNVFKVDHAKIELLDIRDGGEGIRIDKVDLMKEQKWDEVNRASV